MPKNSISTNKFINPYHFVNLPNQKAQYQEEKEEQRYTGKINVRITTKTPLFIPNTSCDDAFEMNREVEGHKSYDFFSYNKIEPNKNNPCNEPVIPGSAIRGMIRSVYETLTGSCMAIVDDEKTLSKRINVYFDLGLIGRNENGQLVLYQIRKERIKKIDQEKVKRWREGQEVPYHDVTTGYLIKGEPGPDMGKKSKHYCKIVPKPDEKEICDGIVLQDESVECLKQVLLIYQDDRVNKNLEPKASKEIDSKKIYHKGYKEYREEFERFLKNEKEEQFFPVYYSKLISNRGEERIYLSPSCVTREVYRNKLNKILEKQGCFQPCTNESKLCPACNLFGMIGKSGAKASSIRFADAIVEDRKPVEQYYYECPITLEELVSPKITATEFYLKEQPGADFWTYDYYVKNGQIVFYVPKIAGRKYYWHHTKVKLMDGVQPTKRNITVRALRDNVVFKEEIYFDDITKMQLKQLLYICNISNLNVENPQGYKLGAGKPLGLGSVEMAVENVNVRKIQIENGKIFYKEIELEEVIKNEIGKMPGKEDYESLKFEKQVRKAFDIITQFDAVGESIVTYPVTEQQMKSSKKYGRIPQNDEKDKENFKWFSVNRGGKIKSRTQMKFKRHMTKLESMSKAEILALDENKK